MKTSPTHFAGRCLDIGEYSPPATRKGPRYASADRCWLCGGATDGVGWPLRTAIKTTFTNHNQAAAPSSDAVCQPCAYFATKESWELYLATLPGTTLKTGHAMSWRCYSHLFTADHHECPSHRRLRDILLNPPQPPFMLIFSFTGQKHLIFRGKVAQNRRLFPVQAEEETIMVDRIRMTTVIRFTEALLAGGFTRKEVLTGRYNQARIRRSGLAIWRPLEQGLAVYRRRYPLYLKMAALVGHAPIKEGK
ncbi:MAG: hypothetical protein P1P81_09260 [Desulfobulbales bacterium]|nr:hypothetical protein [Desulfobulbales bacterium]